MTTSTITAFPVLTVKDPQLQAGGVIRDPLGLLGIWRSGLGRALVPNLASSVTSLKGVVALLLIQYVYEESRRKPGGVERNKCYRMLEGIVEHCLKTELKVEPLFGKQALATDDFTASSGDRRTVANGLRQYYQGTCIRAGLLTRDTRELSREARQWCEAQHGTQSLVPVMSDLLQAGNCKMSELPPGFIKQLGKFISDEAWRAHLRKPLLESGAKYEFAHLCSKHRDARNLKKTLKGIYTAASEGEHGSVITAVTAQIECCEPFLCWCQGIFDWLRQNERELLRKCVTALAPYMGDVAEAAARFQQIDERYRTDRYRQIFPVVEAASAGTEEFIAALLEYHGRVMGERDGDPLVAVEGDGAICVFVRSSGDSSLEALRGRVLNGEWNNDYYLTAAAKIYEQTRER